MSGCRILLYCAAPLSDGGGVQTMVLDLARWLREHGHRVVTAWPDATEEPDRWHLPLEVGPGSAAKLRAGRDLVRLAARVRRFRPDVVNIHFPRGQTAYFRVLRKALNFRLILSFHNSDVRDPSPAGRAALPSFLRSADRVTAVSNDLSPVIRGFADIPVEVIANGVDTAWWTPGAERRDETLVVAAGRLLAMKGFDLLLPAFARGAPESARLTVAGEGTDRDALMASARELGIADRVSFPGQLSKPALRDLYRQAGLFVLSSRREGMPLALIEAMACGTPVIATAVNGVPDVMTPESGAMVPSEDVEALAAAFSDWFASPGTHRQVSDAARRRAESFSDDATYARYERVLTEGLRCST